MIRIPDYERGRFFISPILGCNAQCTFCYIYNKGYKTKAERNAFSIEETLEYLNNHENFRLGKNHTIISIGAWGDPFPRYNKTLCLFSLNWLKILANLGNPIQIMSRYELHPEVISDIALLNQYDGHILYSTSISSIENFKRIEPYSDEPEMRLRSLKQLSGMGVATNVMIKPFIQGLTDLETIKISNLLKKYDVKQCVVGDLLLDERIKAKLTSSNIFFSKSSDDINVQILDCTSGENYEVSASKKMDAFSIKLSDSGIKVFKKSSCVNSYILNKPNPANYIKDDPNNYCIKCGACN